MPHKLSEFDTLSYDSKINAIVLEINQLPSAHSILPRLLELQNDLASTVKEVLLLDCVDNENFRSFVSHIKKKESSIHELFNLKITWVIASYIESSVQTKETITSLLNSSLPSDLTMDNILTDGLRIVSVIDFIEKTYLILWNHIVSVLWKQDPNMLIALTQQKERLSLTQYPNIISSLPGEIFTLSVLPYVYSSIQDKSKSSKSVLSEWADNRFPFVSKTVINQVLHRIFFDKKDPNGPIQRFVHGWKESFETSITSILSDDAWYDDIDWLLRKIVIEMMTFCNYWKINTAFIDIVTPLFHKDLVDINEMKKPLAHQPPKKVEERPIRHKHVPISVATPIEIKLEKKELPASTEQSLREFFDKRNIQIHDSVITKILQQLDRIYNSKDQIIDEKHFVDKLCRGRNILDKDFFRLLQSLMGKEPVKWIDFDAVSDQLTTISTTEYVSNDTSLMETHISDIFTICKKLWISIHQETILLEQIAFEGIADPSIITWFASLITDILNGEAELKKNQETSYYDILGGKYHVVLSHDCKSIIGVWNYTTILSENT